MNKTEKISLIKKLQNRKIDIKKIMQMEYDTITKYGIESKKNLQNFKLLHLFDIFVWGNV